MTELKKRGRPPRTALSPKPDLPQSLSYTAEDGESLKLRAYAPMLPAMAEGQWVKPKFIAGLPITCLTEHLQLLARTNRAGLFLVMSHKRPPVNVDHSDEALARLDAMLRRLEVTNQPRDRIFLGRRTTIHFTVHSKPLQHSAPALRPVYFSLDSVEVDI